MAKDFNNKYHYGIPKQDLLAIKKRDINCVYCHKKILVPNSTNNRKDWATIEHLNYKSDWDSVKDFVTSGKSATSIVAMCCFSCNSSRGSRPIKLWFKTQYCKDKNITIDSVSSVVKEFINKYERN